MPHVYVGVYTAQTVVVLLRLKSLSPPLSIYVNQMDILLYQICSSDIKGNKSLTSFGSYNLNKITSKLSRMIAVFSMGFGISTDTKYVHTHVTKKRLE